MVGGNVGISQLSSVELFPHPPSNTCSIPDLPQPRTLHSLSLLSGGRLVVCGGWDEAFNVRYSCLSWIAGNNSWNSFYRMRCLPIMPYIRNHSMERWTHTAWTPPSLPNSIVLLGGTVGSGDAAFTAEIVPGDDNKGFLLAN